MPVPEFNVQDSLDQCWLMIELLQNSSEAAKKTKTLIKQIENYMTTQYDLNPVYNPLDDTQVIALMDELYDLKLELQSDLQNMAETIGPNSTNLFRDLCEFAAENPSLLFMASEICSSLDTMDEMIGDLNKLRSAFEGDIFPFGTESPHEYWGMIDPNFGKGTLLMPFGHQTVDITVAVMYNMTMPGCPLFHNVRLLTSLAAFICARGPAAASEVYTSYYSKACSCPITTYYYLPIALFDISDAFTDYVDALGHQVQVLADTNEQSITNFWAERREGQGKTITCYPSGDCYTDPEIITATDINGTAFQRLLAKMMTMWGMVFEDYHMIVGNESIDGWKGKQLLIRHDVYSEPQQIILPSLPVHLTPIILAIDRGNLQIGDQSDMIKFTLMYNGEQIEYDGEELVYL